MEERSHQESLPRKEMVKHPAVETAGYLRMRRWWKTLVGADAHIGPRSAHRLYGNLRRIRWFPTGRCGHRPLQTRKQYPEPTAIGKVTVLRPKRAFRPRSDKKSRASARNMTRPRRIFLPTFSGKTDGTKLQTSEAFAIWRGRATERTRPAACGGARDCVRLQERKLCAARLAWPNVCRAKRRLEFVRTSRRRHSCGVAESTALR